MLNSILQQKGDIPEILVSISYVPNNGNPTTESLISFFRERGLNILDVVLEEDQIHNRAIPRNIRAKETNVDWILFADADLVYDPNFFSDLKKKLESEEFKNETKVLGADRHSLKDNFCIDYFNKCEKQYPCEIPHVAKVAASFPVKWIKGKNVAAGYFQLARVQAIKDKGGIYSGRKRDFWRSTKSDKQFRAHMGGRKPIDVLPIYHLNHDRLGPEIQR